MHKALPLETMTRLIRAARGDDPADLVLANARVVNVFTGEVEEADVAVRDGYVVGLGSYQDAAERVDVEKNYVVPGYLDAHMHLESSMVSPAEFARAVVPRG
ncbi:MAG: adenine deaminase, partial [Candidatus Eremiobacterota bacterium]